MFGQPELDSTSTSEQPTGANIEGATYAITYPIDVSRREQPLQLGGHDRIAAIDRYGERDEDRRH